MYRGLSHGETVRQYVDEVLDGTIVAGKLEKAACQRYLDDLKHAKEKGFWLDEGLASHACDFFPLLKHSTSDYAGHPFHLHPFQTFITWNLAGWRRLDNGSRRFRQAFVSLGRGNGKSCYAAGLDLYFVAYDGEPRAEGYCVATKKDQAKLVFDEVCRFVDANPDLKSRMVSIKNNLFHPESNSTLMPLGSDSRTLDGLNPYIVSADEIHAWAKYQKELFDKIITAMGKRSSPLLFMITTAGDENSELWHEIYRHACDVVDRDIQADGEDRFVFICEIDDEDDPLDEAVWPKANPLLSCGVVKIDHLRSMAGEAKSNPEAKARFKRYHCNKQIVSYGKMITPELWARGNADLPELEGRACYAGFDWGWKNDLTALCYVFPLEKKEVESELLRQYAVLLRCWIPQNAERDLAKPPWSEWIESGILKVTPKKGTDTAEIYDQIRRDQERFEIVTVDFDPNNASEFGSKVEKEYGIKPFKFRQVHQRYNEPTRELMACLESDRLIHGGNPILFWSAMNMAIEMDPNDYIRPVKKHSEDKIDPMCALIMGLHGAMMNEEDFSSEYENPGMLAL